MACLGFLINDKIQNVRKENKGEKKRKVKEKLNEDAEDCFILVLEH